MGGMFWQVGLLIILVTVIDMTIRRWAWPQVRYVLWGLVFLKLVIPPTWQMPTSVVSWAQPLIMKHLSIQIDPAESQLLSELNIVSELQNKEELMNQTSGLTYLFLCWLAGAAIYLLALAKKISRLPKLRRSRDGLDASGQEPPGWFFELMTETARGLNLKKTPAVVFSKDASTPGVYGLFKPVLLLPEGYLSKLSRQQVEHVLVHELCHLKRGDLVVHWLCLLLQIFYWFNPLLIWTRRQMRHVCEICCDLSVANFLRERTASYRDTLLKTARELFSETLEPKLGLLGVFEEPFRLIPRLKWLEKKTWENRKWKSAATVCTSLIMITCVLPMSGLSQPASPPEDKVYEMNEVGEPPKVLQAFPPKYPIIAKEENISGRVVVEFVVNKGGEVKDEWVIEAEPPDVFEEAALEAIRQYLFAPGTINGEAVDVRVKLPIVFSLGGPPGSQIDQLDTEFGGSPDQMHDLAEGDRPPRIINSPPPQYPYDAKKNKIEGWALLRFVVGIDGKVKEPEVVESEPEGVFEQSALDAILKTEFEPAIKDGTPVLCIAEMQIGYELHQPGDKERFSVKLNLVVD